MPASKTDKFANKFFGEVVGSGATTLTFEEIHTNVNIFDKIAWVLNRLEWYVPQATLDLFVATGDGLEAALTSSQQITALGLDNPSVIDLFSINRKDAGTAATAWYHYEPFIRDFSGLPGGGLIITPRPLYLAVLGVSIATAPTIRCRGYFQQLELSADEYLELVDFYRIVT